jgi:hypothetical protein
MAEISKKKAIGTLLEFRVYSQLEGKIEALLTF